MTALAITFAILAIIAAGFAVTARRPADPGPWGPNRDGWPENPSRCPYVSRRTDLRCVYFQGHDDMWPHDSHVRGGTVDA